MIQDRPWTSRAWSRVLRAVNALRARAAERQARVREELDLERERLRENPSRRDKVKPPIGV